MIVDYSGYKCIKIEKKEKVATVILNRPEVLNAFNTQMHSEMEDIWEDLDRDDQVNAVVLTGAGRAFSAGGDIKAIEAWIKDPSLRILMSAPQRLINNLLALEKPVIAALNGDTIGLGASLALFCDVIIAGENVRIGDPHVSVGLVAGDGGCVIWPLLIGVAKAKEYLMTGDLITATEAERIGLINKVVPPEEVMPTAMALAQRLASGPIKAISGTKACINKVLKEQVNLILEASTAKEWLCFDTEDHSEAVKAFLEKRKPVFKGR